MNKLETELQALAMTPAPEQLDRRVEQTIMAHASHHPGIVSMRVPLWACAAACLLFFAVGMVVRHALPAPVRVVSAPVVCSVEGGPAFRAVFAPESVPTDFFLRKKRILTLHTNNKGTQG